MKRLRGHHLLCVHGFRGMGYSPKFVHKMEGVVKDMRDKSIDFPIRVVVALDETCSACPHNGGDICKARPDSQAHVTSMDRKVLAKLGLTAGESYMKSDIIQRIQHRVEPDDLDDLCAGCSWLQYGVCKEGIRNVKEGNILQR